MSDVVHYKGKIRKVDKLPGESLEDVCKRVANQRGFHELTRWCDTWVELVSDEAYGECAIIDDELFLVEGIKKDLYDQDVFCASKNSDGSFNFEVRYYNGGTSFDEAIEKALKNMEE